MMTIEHRGVIVPMLTPFGGDEDVDTSRLRWLTDYLIESGVDGLFPCGSTGEFFALSMDEKAQVIDVVVDQTAGRLPVYAGAGAVGTREAVRLAQMSEERGADALCVITPFYLAPSQDELYDHYATICSATRLPVLAYNNPGRTGGVNLSVALVTRLAEIDNFVGIKDSSGDVGLTGDYITHTQKDFAVFQGRDDLFYASFAVGAVGAVAAVGNVVPELVVEMYQAVRADDWQRALALQRRITPLRRALALGTFPTVLKEAMTMLGKPVGQARAPVTPLTEASRESLRTVLANLEVLAPETAVGGQP